MLVPAAPYERLRPVYKHTHVMLQGCSSYFKILASSVISRDNTWRCVLPLLREPSNMLVYIATGHTLLYLHLQKHLSACMQSCLSTINPQ